VLRPELVTLYSRQTAFEKLIALKNKKEAANVAASTAALAASDAKDGKHAAAPAAAAGSGAPATATAAASSAMSDNKSAPASAAAATENGAAAGVGPPSSGPTAAASSDLSSLAADHKMVGEEDAAYIKALSEISFNPDVYTGAKLADGDDKLKRDRETVAALSKYLLDTVIPKLVADFKSLEVSPVDAHSLCTILHERGINLRYLGRVATLCAAQRLHYIEDLAVHEMIVRAAKHLLAEQMRLVKPDKAKHVRDTTRHATSAVQCVCLSDCYSVWFAHPLSCVFVCCRAITGSWLPASAISCPHGSGATAVALGTGREQRLLLRTHRLLQAVRRPPRVRPQRRRR
jgi:hypothetical protein